jgi:HEAT repeat protein
MVTEGKADDAVKIYDQIRKAKVNKQRTIEAIRGLILAKGDAGIPLLLEQLKSEDRQLFGIGLRVARELPGSKATEALVAELKNMKPQRQAFLLRALADRGDRKAVPALLNAIENGPQEAACAAMAVMEKIGDASCVPVLAKIAVGGQKEQAAAAKVSLVRLLAEDVNPAIVAQLPKATGKTRQLFLELVGLRRIEAAVPELAKYISDADAGVRTAALSGIAALGSGKQVPDLVKALLKTKDAKERAAFERALAGTASRGGASCAAPLTELTKSSDSGLRAIGLRALSCAGGPEALKAVKAALSDDDPTVQDEAARTLCTWPNQWPEDASVVEPLLTLAKQGKKETHKILALRGYLQYLRGNKKLGADDRMAKLSDVLPQVKRPDEKKLVCSVLGTIPSGSALEQLTAYAAEPALAQEACLAIVDLCKRRDLKGASKDVRKKALQAAAQKLKNRRAKKDAQNLLRGIK